LDVEQELSASDAAKVDLNSILAEHDFQTVTVSRHAGRNLRVKRTLPIPLKHKKKWETGNHLAPCAEKT